MQAADINALFGFRIECIERLGERNGLWAWTRLNSLFNWLPLAACIEDKVLCMHGGERNAPPDCSTPSNARCQCSQNQRLTVIYEPAAFA